MKHTLASLLFVAAILLLGWGGDRWGSSPDAGIPPEFVRVTAGGPTSTKMIDSEWEPIINQFSIASGTTTADWSRRSFGGGVAADWLKESMLCWEPGLTMQLWLNPHCSDLSLQATRKNGTPCAADGDCVGANSHCVHGGGGHPTVMWDMAGHSPDEIDFAVVLGYYPNEYDPPYEHEFGPPGTVYPLPFSLSVPAGAPAYGGGAGQPICNGGAINFNGVVWVESVDIDTISLYRDDGDLVQEIGGDDVGLDCDDGARSDWQNALLRPLDGSGGSMRKVFEIKENSNYAADDTDGGDSTPMALSFQMVKGIYGFDFVGADGLGEYETQKVTFYYDQGVIKDYRNVDIFRRVTWMPGECILPMGYGNAVAVGDLEDIVFQFGGIQIMECVGCENIEP